MANYFARKAGNINDTDVWATTPSGTAGAQTFVSGDVLYANNFAITVNVSTNLGSTGEVRNDNTNSATTGGGFTLSNGVTLTANVIQGATTTACVTYAGTTGNSATIVGNIAGGAFLNSQAATNTSSGTLNITGNITGGPSSTSAVGLSNTSTGIVNIVGNCTGGSGISTASVINTSSGTINITGNCIGGSGASAHGANNNSTGTINITGNCTGASGNSAHGAHNASTGTINITGNCTGGTATANFTSGANNNSTGTLNITGNCTGGATTAVGATANVGARNTGTGILSITGNCYGSPSATAAGAANISTGQMSVNGSIYASEQASGVEGGARGQVTRLTGPFYTTATFGVNPNTCLAWRWASTLNTNTFIEVPTTNLTSTRNLVTPDNATNFPSVANVRSGVTFGVSGALTGTCAVPSAGSVLFGVPVDNTTGTATMTPADFWSYSVTTASVVTGSLGQRLARAARTADVIAFA